MIREQQGRQWEQRGLTEENVANDGREFAGGKILQAW